MCSRMCFSTWGNPEVGVGDKSSASHYQFAAKVYAHWSLFSCVFPCFFRHGENQSSHELSSVYFCALSESSRVPKQGRPRDRFDLQGPKPMLDRASRRVSVSVLVGSITFRFRSEPPALAIEAQLGDLTGSSPYFMRQEFTCLCAVLRKFCAELRRNTVSPVESLESFAEIWGDNESKQKLRRKHRNTGF